MKNTIPSQSYLKNFMDLMYVDYFYPFRAFQASKA